ncbi:hypothetical protein PRIPAC_78001 [Pristionchus pacificus]|uniref:Uncharacterized protein n=1 Tax=Pristionchus pacificus TaxID=54126 RepID=A0A2A6CQ05_PRIPA|nr:hypothetical protein PRIPAC_78001 [Pristionchus pacificus]|eukprot:PDM80200.1 hypothetical protein PRIPAC_32779 [Pristionchus pacificus]
MSSSRDPVTCLAQIKCPLSGRELEKAEVSSIRVDMNRPAYWPANFILGYSKELFPAFFIDPFHQYTGTLFQIWKEIERTITGSDNIDKNGVTKYDFDFDLSDGITRPFEGIFGAIDEGEVLSCINGLSLQVPSLIRSFRYSSPVFYQTINFYRQLQDVPSLASQLSFYLVFQSDEILLIILCVIAIVFINIIAQKRTVNNGLCSVLLSLSRFVLFPLSIHFLLIIYSAAFQGDMVIPYVSPDISFSEMLANLRQGKWNLLTTIGMTDGEKEALSGATNGAHVEIVESDDGIVKACSSDRVVIRLFDIERTIQLTTDKFCPMQKITPTTGRDESLRILLTQNGDTLPYYLLFSRKRTSRKVVEHVNYVLRMFSEDQMENFWNVRFVREKGSISLTALKRYETAKPDLHRYDPITKSRFNPMPWSVPSLKDALFGPSKLSIDYGKNVFRRIRIGLERKNYEENRKSWYFSNVIFTIEYFKAFDVFAQLSTATRRILAGKMSLLCTNLTNLLYSIQKGKSYLLFPDGMAAFAGMQTCFTEQMERTANWHRYVKELQLDGNECVLLKVLLILSLSLDDASASERALLTSHSESYAKIIFSYVMARRGREQVCRQNSNLRSSKDVQIFALELFRDFFSHFSQILLIFESCSSIMLYYISTHSI